MQIMKLIVLLLHIICWCQTWLCGRVVFYSVLSGFQFFSLQLC